MMLQQQSQEEIITNLSSLALSSLVEIEKKGEPSRTTSTGGVVRFSTVRVREYPIIVGDNPSVSRGPPITLSWNYTHDSTYHINEFENCVIEDGADVNGIDGAHKRRRKRSYRELKMEPSKRNEMLMRQGYTRGEIRELTSSVHIAKQERQQTIKSLSFSPVHELIEKIWTRGAIRKMVSTSARDNKAQERDYIKLCLDYYDNNKNSKINHNCGNTRSTTKKCSPPSSSPPSSSPPSSSPPSSSVLYSSKNNKKSMTSISSRMTNISWSHRRLGHFRRYGSQSSTLTNSTLSVRE